MQLFTIRKYIKSHDQIRATLHKLNIMGISHIEIARVKFDMEEAKLIRQVCDKLGMSIGSSQIKYQCIIKDFENIVAVHKVLGCSYIGVSVLPTQYILKGEKGIRSFAILLNNLGERLSGRGLKLLYHHHHMEFARYGPKTGLEILMEATDPIYVNLMLDTYWAQRGGKNPVDLIHQFSRRIKVIHLRDYQVVLSLIKADYIVKDCALGDGNLDILGIIVAARRYNVPYLPIEQDSKTPFEAIERSVNYLKAKGFIV